MATLRDPLIVNKETDMKTQFVSVISWAEADKENGTKKNFHKRILRNVSRTNLFRITIDTLLLVACSFEID